MQHLCRLCAAVKQRWVTWLKPSKQTARRCFSESPAALLLPFTSWLWTALLAFPELCGIASFIEITRKPELCVQLAKEHDFLLAGC